MNGYVVTPDTHAKSSSLVWHGIRNIQCAKPKMCVMKQWVTLLAATALFASCSKQNLEQENDNQENLRTTAMRSTQGGAYVSEWETSGSWIKTDAGNTSRFTWSRKTPEIGTDVLNGGLALTYAKLAPSDPSYAHLTKPTMLPFYFLPESERPIPKTFYFSQEVSNGTVSITYTVPFTKDALPRMNGGASLGSLQFQTIVLPKSFLDSLSLTAETVQLYYTYDQVMNLINQ